MWYIGQKIVAVRNHSQGIFKEGDTFVIKAISNPICKCKSLYFDIGLRSAATHDYCNQCNTTSDSKDNIWWLNEISFAPLDEIQAHESAVNELLQELNLQIQ